MLSAGLFDQSIVKKQDLLGTEVDHRFARVSNAGRYRSMKASTCAAKVCFTLRRMTVVSEEEPFFCLRTADLLALRTLPFMGAMIPQSPCEHNALNGTDLAITPYSTALARRFGGLTGALSHGGGGLG
jgi:hypothetical protein